MDLIQNNAIVKEIELIIEQIVKKKRLTTFSLLGTSAVLFSSYIFVKWMRMRKFFKTMNIPGPTPKPIFGNILGVISKGIVKHDEEIFKKYGKIVGYFEAGTPIILCTDIDMIKHVMIKDFNYFVNRRVFESLQIDPFNEFMTVLKDDEWKSVRAIVTTTFTSGKLKQMLDSMNPCIDGCIRYFDGVAKSGKTFEAKEVFQKLTFDVICSCGFGIQTDSINNPDDPFIKEMKKLLSAQVSITFVIAILFPRFMQFLAKKRIFEILPSKSVNFFKDFVALTVGKRRSKEQIRNDFIQIMVDHEDKPTATSVENNDYENADENVNLRWKILKKSLTNSEIFAQAILFLVAGSETTATTISYVSYLLAKHPDIQNRLYHEIAMAYQEHNEINYEMVNSIEYLDMVVDETLRLFPPVIRTDRECNADYQYKDIKIPKGTIWSACIWALHHDPSVYPEPEKFDPERFNAEERKKRDNCAFIPFGTGPRNCVGLRFALLETKLFLCKLLLKYEFVVCNETPKKIEIDKSGLAKSVEPIILRIVERN